MSNPIDADERSAPLMVYNQTRNQKPETRNFFLLIPLALILLTLVVFWPVGGHDFINYDDNTYVTENGPVLQGLTMKGLLWAATTFHAGNWHPVTWFSHMLDVSLFGMNPAGHHWMNLLFHLANVLLLFFLLRRMTHALWPSALVATLFAIHPLHVESVAWVAERKDVLSAFFGLLTLWAYVGYAEKRVSSFRFHVSSFRPESRKAMLSYLAVLLFFTLSLMAKPMLVTLPFLMLLLDYWPLRRTSFKFQVSSFRFKNLKPETLKPETDFNQPGTRNQKPGTRNLIFEKLPLFALAAASSVITYLVQQKAGSVTPFQFLPLSVRLGNAVVSYVAYIGKMLWPSNLAIFYRYVGGSLPLWQMIGSALLLLLLSAAVIRMGNRRPYLIVGWLWYLGTLVPVIGIVQVGAQGMADRYTYIPLIGIFIMIVWGVFETSRRVMLARAIVVLIVLLGVVARVQVGYWRNSVTLFEHALQATEWNQTAHNHLGLALAKQGKLEEARRHYSEAIRLYPDYFEAHGNLAALLVEEGKLEEASRHYSEALRINPNYVEGHNDLAMVLGKLGKPEEAMKHYSEAIRIYPDSFRANFNLAAILAGQGRLEEAAKRYSEAIRIYPGSFEAHSNLAAILAQQGRLDEAVRHYSEALSIKPDHERLHYNLGLALAGQGKVDEAISHFSEAIRIRPDDPLLRYNLGIVYEKLGRRMEAIAAFEAAVRINPDFAEARKKLESK
jgi:tetratricopeptide (TPR) repeat protein